ncbi:MAG: hypothetical protein AAB796_01580 [Patescibacteria group bacterium]
MCLLGKEAQKQSDKERVELYLGGTWSQKFLGSVFKWIFYFMLLLTGVIELLFGSLNYIPNIPDERKIQWRVFVLRWLKALEDAVKKIQSRFHRKPS